MAEREKRLRDTPTGKTRKKPRINGRGSVLLPHQSVPSSSLQIGFAFGGYLGVLFVGVLLRRFSLPTMLALKD